MGTGNTLTFWTVSFMATATTTFGRAISYTGATNDFNDVHSWEVERNNGANSLHMVRNLVDTGNMSVTLLTPFVMIGTVNSSGVMTLYINGVASTTGTQSGNWGTNGSACLGGGVHETEWWDGAVSEAGISTNFTNSTDVTTLYNSLKAKWGL